MGGANYTEMTLEEIARPPDQGQITLRLPIELLTELRRQAQEQGYTVHDLMLFILWEHCGSIPPG